MVFPDNHFVLGLGDISKIRTIDIFDKFFTNPIEEARYEGIDILRMIAEPAFIWMAAKILLGVTLTPIQAAIYSEIYNRPYSLLVASRGFSKSFGLGLILILKAVLTAPKIHGGTGMQAVVVGSGFRQSKIIFEYINGLWERAPVLRSICGEGDGPYREQDRFTMRINGNSIIFIPLGNGERVRGLRATMLLCLEKDSLVETDQGLVRIQDFDNFGNKRVVTGNPDIPYERPVNFIRTNKTDVYEIITEYGFRLRCSEHHQLMTPNGWKIGKNLKAGEYVESANYYKFPEKYVIDDETGDILDERTAWFMGVCISKGSIGRKYRISIKNTDRKLIDKLAAEWNMAVTVQPAKMDARGFQCGESYTAALQDKPFRQKLARWGMEYTNCYGKKIPSAILQSPRSVVVAFLSGLFEGDGSGFAMRDHKGYIRFDAAYYSVSERLCRDVHILVHKLGYVGGLHSRLCRNSKISSEKLQWMVRFNEQEGMALAKELNIERFNANLAKVDIADRQDEGVAYDKFRDKWVGHYRYLGKSVKKRFKTKKAAIKFREQGKALPRFLKIRSVKKLEEQQVLYDYTLPSTKSFYAEGVRNHNCDEFNSTATDVFETVIAGFTAVSSDPISNVEYYKKMKYLRSINDIDGLKELQNSFTVHRNQTILMGTAGHQFQPFYKYFNKYKHIIESHGDMDYLKRNITAEEIPENLDYRDYSICHVPYSLIKEEVEGFMDEASVSKSKATMDSDRFLNEYEAIFTKDSTGFFKMSVINANTQKYRISKTGDNVGENYCLGHVFGVDVASEFDKFAVCVLAIYPNHAKVVNMWTMNRKSFEERKHLKLTNITEYYSFCVRKIRELIQCFPPLMSHPNGAYIACDSQGGGNAIREAFHDLDKVKDNESLIYEIIVPGEEKMSDGLEGEHCLWMVNFANNDIRNDLYYGVRKILEDGRVKFPYWDTISMEEAMDADETQRQRYMDSKLGDNELILFDTLEDTFLEIQKTIDELCSIRETRGPAGKPQFKTEAQKNSEGKTVYMHKDRAAALQLAALLYKQYFQSVDPLADGIMTIGGIVQKTGRKNGMFFENTNQIARNINKTFDDFKRVNDMLK